jgi:hypothetical protein
MMTIQTLEVKMAANFFSQSSRVTISGMQLIAGLAFDFYSTKKNPIDYARIRLTQEVFNIVIPVSGGEVIIELMDELGAYDVLFKGQITRITGTEIIVKDDMLKIMQAEITGTFLNILPEEFVNIICDEAGIVERRIASSGVPPRERVVVRKKDGVFLLSETNRLYGIEHVASFDAGIFFWGERPDQELIHQFVYGENIIERKVLHGEYIILTVPHGVVKHSHVIGVNDPTLIGVGDFEVDRVKYTRNMRGFLRMELAVGEQVVA